MGFQANRQEGLRQPAGTDRDVFLISESTHPGSSGAIARGTFQLTA
jgi:hypothetical protein